MRSDILKGLNEYQTKAVTHYQGPCMVLAGPGSGKTLTIAKRIEYLIKVYKVRPEEILVITFTKYAANEMKRRYHELCGSISNGVTCGTFHGIYYGILKWAYGISSENIITENEKKQILKMVLQKKELGEFSVNYDSDERYEDLLDEIESVKNQGISIETYVPTHFKEQEFRMIFAHYEHEKNLLRKVDFEDMLILCKNLFLKHPDILEAWQKKFRYILVDEFQDVNQVQYDVLKLLCGEKRNLFIVGDDDQSIYGFRGAKPGIMQTFKKDFPDMKSCLLNINYRSDANIVRLSLKVVENNKIRFAKKIFPNKESTQKIELQENYTVSDESKFVVNTIRKLLDCGTEPSEIAVLSRTVNDLRAVAEELTGRGIRYSMRESMQSLYDQPPVMDMISYLRLAAGKGERSDLIRIANKPNRYISRDSLMHGKSDFEGLKDYYKEKDWMIDRVNELEYHLDFLSRQTPYAAVQYIRKRIGYDEYIRSFDYPDSKREKIFEQLDELQESGKEFQTIQIWFDHISKMRTMQTEKKREGEGITLQSIHSSKGLEFEYVFMIHCNESVIPHKKALLSEEIEEERRLFYVAMTRAKKKLYISIVKEKNGKELPPSRFVRELLAI